MTNNKNNCLKIIPLFDSNDDKIELESIMNINLDKLYSGMSKFQIDNFVLNKRENTNDLFLYKQTVLELYTRIQALFDLRYQYRKLELENWLAQGEIEEIRKKDIGTIKKDALIKLQELERENIEYKLFNIKKQAVDKLRECKIFAKHYERLKYIEDLSEEQIAKLEEEGWKIKSAYFSELIERYAITPRGYMPFPHEKNGLEGLINILYKKQIEKENAGGG